MTPFPFNDESQASYSAREEYGWRSGMSANASVHASPCESYTDISAYASNQPHDQSLTQSSSLNAMPEEDYRFFDLWQDMEISATQDVLEDDE